MMENAADLAKAVDFALRGKDKRGDERFAHVSDSFGCDLATWARRRGEPMLPHTPETLVKFAMGNAVEKMVADAVREKYPGDSSHNLRIAWNPATGECVELAADAEPKPGFMIGHLDVELEDDQQVLEIKSTVFYGNKRPAEPSEHYVTQASTYATARKAKKFAVVIVDRASGAMVTFWFDAADFYVEATGRALEVLANTDPEVPVPPAPNPRTNWACSYCDYGACSLNKNKAKGMVPA